MSKLARFCAVLLVLAPSSWGFHTGAPDSACDTMTPGHGPSPQSGRSPYRVIISKTQVPVGEPVEMIITAPTAGPPFKGFFIQVHPVNGDQPVGEFDPSADPDKAQPVTCGHANSAMTHKDLSFKTKVTLRWTPPGDGDYVPVVTMVKDKETFWVKEKPDQTIKVVASGSDASVTSGSARVPGEAAADAKPKNSNDISSRSNESTPTKGSGNEGAGSSVNSMSMGTTAMLFLGTILIQRLF